MQSIVVREVEKRLQSYWSNGYPYIFIHVHFESICGICGRILLRMGTGGPYIERQLNGAKEKGSTWRPIGTHSGEGHHIFFIVIALDGAAMGRNHTMPQVETRARISEAHRETR